MELIYYFALGVLLYGGVFANFNVSDPELLLLLRLYCFVPVFFPELDRLPRLFSIRLAQYTGNVCFHNIFAFLLFSGVGIFATIHFEVAEPGLQTIVLCIVGTLGYALHLLVDWLANKPVALLFPFRKTRFAKRMIWFSDPYIPLICIIGGANSLARWPAILLVAYIAALCWFRKKHWRQIRSNKHTFRVQGGTLQNYPYAPWRAFYVAQGQGQSSKYFMRRVSLESEGPWHFTLSGRGSNAESIALTHPFFKKHAELANFPRYELRQRKDGSLLIVVDDVLWWNARGRRVHCYVAEIDANKTVTSIKETKPWHRGPFGPPEPLPLKLQTPIRD